MQDNNVLSEGIRLYSKHEYAKALEFFLSLPSDSGADKIELAYYLGLCYSKLEKYEDALLYLEQVVTSGAKIERIFQCRFLLAVIYIYSGRLRLADFELNKLLSTGFMPASVYASIAFIAWKHKDIEKCLSYYEKSLEYDPENVTALNGMGYVLASENRDLTRALSLCKRAVKSSPKSASCLDSLGWVYYKLGLYDDSLQYLIKAEQLCKNNAEITNHIKAVKMKVGAL